MSDPTVKRTLEDMAEAKAEFEDYWRQMYPTLRHKVTAAPTGAAPDLVTNAREQALSSAKLNLEQIKLNEKLLSKRLESAKIEVRNANNEIWDVQFAKEELTREQSDLEKIKQHRDQMEYDAKNGTRVKLVAEAKPNRVPSSDNRMKAVAAAPVLMLAMSCLLFVLIEFKSGRVADPDELSQRVRVGVIGVVRRCPV